MGNSSVSEQKESEETSIAQLASMIMRECTTMESECQKDGVSPPSMLAGTSTAFWSESTPQLLASRSKALGLLEKLTTLLQGPHDFLHEFVAPNWDHGALYAFLQTSALEHMAAADGHATLSSLSNVSGIPEDKLARILALLRCRNLLREPEPGVFTLTAVSEELIKDEDFKAWVEFQLFETRVASAHLSQALASKPNDYTKGSSGFKQGWGAEMYDWHTTHPEKGDRFRRAMRGVSKSLDPADSLLRKHISDAIPASAHTKIVEIGGRYGFASTSLVQERPNLCFEVRCDSQDFLQRGQALVPASSKDRIHFTKLDAMTDAFTTKDTTNVLAYVVRNVFWNWTNDDAVKLLQELLPTLRNSSSTRMFVTDGVSPAPGQFPHHVEIAYRRRDITTMTMHNVKQRTQVEWLELFSRVDSSLKVRACTGYSNM
ncbi:S-adenosyl-L-methionine-dependent methyltransferase [Phaeosphaeriaceae sp. PMI808]|nr:S-adenosyl-L-methionine-dependent methyltransferase [Phaeosphaeriaceae sp. PMI808]